MTMTRRDMLKRAAMVPAVAGGLTGAVPLLARRGVTTNRYHPALREWGIRFNAALDLLRDEASFLRHCYALRWSLLHALEAHVRQHGSINLVRVPPMLEGNFYPDTGLAFVRVRTRVGTVSLTELDAIAEGAVYNKIVSVT